MKFASFSTETAAQAHRKNHGGWIFSSTCGEHIWFCVEFTPTLILKHRVIDGLNGRLH